MKGGEPISIANIRLDGGTQPRAALNVNAIEDYAKAMSAGAKFPPVAVFYDGEQYWLADGFHRIKAGCAAGLDVIDCEVHQGTVEDAQWYSFSANKANGLRRTNSDKQRAVKAALAHPRSGSLSNSEIARHCGVTTPMVGKWREQLGLSIKDLKIATVTRKGRTYTQDASKIGRPPRISKPGQHATAIKPPDPAVETPVAGPGAAAAAPGRSARWRRIDRLARLTLSFIEATKHFAHLLSWLGETAGEFDEAELILSNASSAVTAVAVQIERKAVAADPLNASRLGIQENKS